MKRREKKKLAKLKLQLVRQRWRTQPYENWEASDATISPQREWLTMTRGKPASFAQLFFSETEDEDLAGFDDELCR